jgi:site-specific recombinase XerD/ribosomal protein L40E
MQKTYQKDFKKYIDRYMERIKSSKDFSDKNKEIIATYIYFLSSSGLNGGTILNHLLRVKSFAIFLKKDLEDAQKEDILRLVHGIETSDYAESIKVAAKGTLKKFYKWLRKTEDYPIEVKWVKTTPRTKGAFSKLPEDILTEEEVKKMINLSDYIRDKALIGCLYESGCRVGELLSMRIRNVQFDKYGTILKVRGKTGERIIRIVAFTPLLATWIELHPNNADPDSPLWISIWSRNKCNCIGHAAVVHVLRNAAIKAHITKSVNPHAFRHARATHLANHLTEPQMRQFFGWTKGSSMTATYVHLSGRDIDKAVLSTYGINDEETDKTLLRPRICTRCKTSNSPDADICMRCGLILSPETTINIDEKIKQANELITALMKDEETRDAIMKGITKLGLQEKVINL